MGLSAQGNPHSPIMNFALKTCYLEGTQFRVLLLLPEAKPLSMKHVFSQLLVWLSLTQAQSFDGGQRHCQQEDTLRCHDPQGDLHAPYQFSDREGS